MAKFHSIRWFSELNPWIDFVVICLFEDRDRAIEIVEKAMTEWYNDPDIYGGYGDAVEWWLQQENIPYEIICHDSEDTSDKYEEFWNKILNQLY